MEATPDLSFRPKQGDFWQKPEGITGIIFLTTLAFALAMLSLRFFPVLLSSIFQPLPLTVLLLLIMGGLVVLIDRSFRHSLWGIFTRGMRWITHRFVKIDPISTLNRHLAGLADNLGNLKRQSAKLRGQMHQLKELIHNNEGQIRLNLQEAAQARSTNQQAELILKSRKAGRLQESNLRLETLYQKMVVLYQVLSRMHDNSKILYEDIQDQVALKEQELKAVHASHSAMQSAKNIIQGDPESRGLFDAAMEAVADDVGLKMGELERFMHASNRFMDTIDLQNGVFEEAGLKALEVLEQEASGLLSTNETLELSGKEVPKQVSPYDKLFE